MDTSNEEQDNLDEDEAAAKWLATLPEDEAEDEVVEEAAEVATGETADVSISRTADDSDSEITDETREDRQPKKQRSERRKGGKSGARSEPGAMEQALRRFQACGRCSYFVADCQIYLGRDTVRLAIEEGPDEWLTLEWADVLRRLTRESYIADDNVFYFYYDGTCPECRRRYTYQTETLDDEEPMFRLKY